MPSLHHESARERPLGGHEAEGELGDHQRLRSSLFGTCLQPSELAIGLSYMPSAEMLQILIP